MPNCDQEEKSLIQQVRDAIFVETAGDVDLDVVADNLGFPRPNFGWANDDFFRAAIQALAVTRHGTLNAYHALLEIVFGPNRTKVGTLNRGQGQPATVIGAIGETFAIAANNMLYITANDTGVTSVISLVANPVATAAEIAAQINASDAQVFADTLVIAGPATVVRIQSQGVVRGSFSSIEIQDGPNNAYALLGLTVGKYWGNDYLGVDNHRVRVDHDYYCDDRFPQLAPALVIDEHGPTEEAIEYCYFEREYNYVISLRDLVDYNHDKYLPYAGTILTDAYDAGSTSLALDDTLGFATAAAPFSVLLNRSEANQEYVEATGVVAGELQLGIGTEYDHLQGESVEIVFRQTAIPVLTTPLVAGVSIAIVVDDSSVFPKADFTVIVDKGEDTEETFWISANDGATTLTISNPLTPTYDHRLGAPVEPAQLQVKGCGWGIDESRASATLQFVIPDDCLPDGNGLGASYLHEATPYGVVAVPPNPLNANITAGDSVAEVDILVLETTPDLLDDHEGGIQGAHKDHRYYFRTVQVYDSGTGLQETLFFTKLREANFLIPAPTGNEFYNPGDTILYFDDVSVFSNLALPFSLILSWGNANQEAVSVVAIDLVLNTATLAVGVVNYHCDFDDWNFGLHSFAAHVQEPCVARLPYMVFTTPAVNTYVAATTEITLLQVPPTVYGTTDLLDGGYLPAGMAHTAVDKFPGPYLAGYHNDVPKEIHTTIAFLESISNPEAIVKIPPQAEVMGYASDIAGTVFTQGAIPVGSRFIVIDDSRMWPQRTGVVVSPYPYPVRIGSEIVNVVNKADFAVFPHTVEGIMDTTTYRPGILEITGGTTAGHTGYDPATRARGDLCILQVEELLLTSTTGFPASGGHVILDMGYNTEEIVEYASTNLNGLVFVPDQEFLYPHSALNFPYSANLNPEWAGVPAVTTVHLIEEAYSYADDGMDYPLYLPSSALGMLLSPSGSTSGSIIDLIRAAGVKVEVVTGGTKPVIDPR